MLIRQATRTQLPRNWKPGEPLPRKIKLTEVERQLPEPGEWSFGHGVPKTKQTNLPIPKRVKFNRGED